MHLLHATCVALDGRGVLLRGPSGAGKSDLALRLIEGGGVLVADDQVICARADSAVHASPPSAIAGLLEVRGLGLMRLDHLPRVPLCLVADLVAPEEVERLPRPASCRIADVALPRLVLAPFEASAPAKLALACRMLAAGDEPVMQLAPAAGGGR